MNSATAGRLRTIIAGHFGVKPNRMSDDTRFHDLGADWLDCLELFMAIEDQVPELQTDQLVAGEIETIGDLMMALEDLAALRRSAVGEGQLDQATCQVETTPINSHLRSRFDGRM